VYAKSSILLNLASQNVKLTLLFAVTISGRMFIHFCCALAIVEINTGLLDFTVIPDMQVSARCCERSECVSNATTAQSNTVWLQERDQEPPQASK